MIRVVAALLLLWEPLNFAVETLTVLPTIAYRGWFPAFELVSHGVVAALSAAGGLGLWNQSPHARSLATVSIVAGVSRTIQSLYWSTLPNATSPGEEPLITGMAVVVGLTALFLVHAARRT